MRSPRAIAEEPLPLSLKTAADVLRATGVPYVILTGSKVVRYVSEEVRHLLGIDADEKMITLRKLESRLGTKLPPLGEPLTTQIPIGELMAEISVVPVAGGADGAAIVFHRRGMQPSSKFAGDPVLSGLRALREALTAAGKYRAGNPLLEDTAAIVDRIVRQLDAPPSPEDWATTQPHKLPGSIPQVVRQAAARFKPIAELKQIQLQVDLASDVHDVVRDAADLEAALEIFLENAIHAVPVAGQIFVGARTSTQNGKPVALFFVMDNGPEVPEPLRKAIFSPDFAWDPSSPDRTGRNLAYCHSFALRHGGQCWVDVKHKTCTFFLSMRII